MRWIELLHEREAELSDSYYKKITRLNQLHYAAEVPYYSTAGPRTAERALLERLTPRSKTLDIGCGAGRFSNQLLAEGHSVIGIDRNSEAVRAAIKRNESYSDRARFVVGDMSQLPFREETFEYVFCPRFSINAVPTPRRRRMAMTEMVRVAAPNATVFVESFNRWWLGRGATVAMQNTITRAYRHLSILLALLRRHKYQGLLPGDIVYPATKVSMAPPGFAHIPTIAELKRLLPKTLAVETISSEQLTRKKGRDYLAGFRYSIWLVINKSESRPEHNR